MLKQNKIKKRKGKVAIIDCLHYHPAIVAQMVSPIIKSDPSLKPEQLCCIASTAKELPSSSFSYNQLFPYQKSHITAVLWNNAGNVCYCSK
jgi:hypothetical protein